MTAVSAGHDLCEKCGHELRAEVAYCDTCGWRTRRARRLVRLAIRVEILGIALIAITIAVFTLIYLR